MPAPVFIGGELHAAAFRLAGARVLCPAGGNEAVLFAEARQSASLVVLTPEVAERLPATLLAAAHRSTRPLLAILGATEATDPLALGIRRLLGTEAPAEADSAGGGR